MTDFKFKKRYGQNFLKNENIIDAIVDSISPTDKDLIIEIGPGAGALTKRLKKYGAKILAFEIDEDTKKYLDMLEDEKTHVEYADFLGVDINSYINRYNYKDLYIVGNLPYYITTPILEHIIDSNIEFKSLTIMVQKEVADRFLANPKSKNYGYMTVLLKYHFNIEKIVDAHPSDFNPAPKVSSTVIKFTPKDKDQINYENFKKLLKDIFQFKRKTINNNLKNYDLNNVKSILEKRGYSLSSRAEELDLETFIELSKIL